MGRKGENILCPPSAWPPQTWLHGTAGTAGGGRELIILRLCKQAAIKAYQQWSTFSIKQAQLDL